MLCMSAMLLFVLVSAYIFSLSPRQSKTSNQSATQEGKKAEAIYVACQSIAYKENCYADQLYALTKREKMEFAKQVLFELQKIDPLQARGCHLMAHKISYAEMEKDPSKWLILLRQQEPDLCTGGFLHGILEIHMKYDKNFNLTASQFPVICSNVKQTGILSCNHILGHLLLVEKGGK